MGGRQVRRWQVVGSWNFDPAKVLEAIAIRVKPGRAQVMEVYPMMKGPETITRGKDKGKPRIWTGTNQPKTLSFFATADEGRAVLKRYIENNGGRPIYLQDRATMEYLDE